MGIKKTGEEKIERKRERTKILLSVHIYEQMASTAGVGQG